MDKSKNSLMTIIAIGIVIAAVLVVYNLMSAPEYSTKHTALTHISDSSSSHMSSLESSSISSLNEESEEEIIASSSSTISSSTVSSSIESETSSAPPAVSSEPQGPININTADFEELQEIKRIGPVLAQRIIDYRNLNGPFESWEELLEVKGIGEKTLETIKQYACL